MSTVGIRALKQNASEVVARAAKGETIEITDRGRPVAKIVPLRTSKYQEMVESGQITPPSLPFQTFVEERDRLFSELAAQGIPTGNTSGLSMEQILEELKEERL
ncbi:type II toxin-antitoxin system Phd/YefM family antitoxin [Leucobacter viscericola]|uniref:Antitoxin n=1 Tax=Leucobacter viscericola TaxID=2714935 RepID=A0A6G7XFU9_9MICO|nr:type II toxin-antitoxin system prevent-host-death family antitoxin [Leucobacter viscericola]QIK63435.1 type II toxin-antitoxin system Phd/YefM family antitoxin [Leucobacter viscericola]